MEQNIYDILFHIFPAQIVISIGKFYIIKIALRKFV